MTGFFVPRHTLSAGDGAHIVAEKKDGPRGESPLTPEQRAMADNGVWLCPTCHRKVDIVQPQNYSVDLLQQWKLSAQIWWQQNQGIQLQAAAWPDVRPQVSRPNSNSMIGAAKFLECHRPLASLLKNLRWQPALPFRQDAPISNEIEHLINQMSSREKFGLTWKSEWSTTFYCNDRELLGYMQDLIRCVDSMVGPYVSFVNRTPRVVNFKQGDNLSQAIENYINAWDLLGERLREYKNFGI